MKKQKCGSSGSIQSQDGGEVHGVHVLFRTRHNLFDNEFVSLLRGMKRVPKCIQISVGAQVGESRA